MHVLVVHFNTPDLISTMVKGLPGQTSRGRPVSIHVLDNCSTLENVRALRNSLGDTPAVTLEFSDQNLGFGAGMNLLASRHDIGHADIVWLLNPDTEVEPGCLDHLEDELSSGEFAVVSPLICSGDKADAQIWYCGGSVDSRNLRVQHQLWARPCEEAPTDPFETEFITGAAPMMYASTFHTIGGFPARYFLYWEDTYFSWKAHALGFRLGVVPAACLWHAAGASSGFGQSQTFYYWSTRNRFAYAADIGVPRRRLIAGRGMFETLRPLARALKEREAKLPKFRAALRGTVDGFLQSAQSNQQETRAVFVSIAGCGIVRVFVKTARLNWTPREPCARGFAT
nr:glycosyltransferase family 2 protein [Mycolicibacterium sp. CBMA 361]